MAVQGLQDAGLHMLDMMADRSPTLAIDVLRYITNNNIALSRGTTEPSHIAGHPQFPGTPHGYRYSYRGATDGD